MNSESKVIFSPYPKQLQFINAVTSGKYSFVCYGGAMGGGKSFVGLATLIFLCKVYPNSKWIVVRESLPSLKRTSIETFKKVLPLNFLESFNQQTQTATFTNGSQIEFMSEDYASDKDFDRFKGVECNGFLLEQIEELNEGLLDVCFIRAGRHRIDPMPDPIVLANVNPTQLWAKKRIYNAYVNGTLPPDWCYISAKIFDNPTLANDSKYMGILDRLDPLTKRRLIDGDWSAFQVNNPYAYCFNEQKHARPCRYDPDSELMLSFDFNVDPITCTAAQNINGQLRYVKEFRLSNSNIYELCDRILVEYNDLNPLYLVTGDATGRARSAITTGNLNYYKVIKDKLNLNINQMKVPRTNPAVSDSRVLMNSLFQNYDVIIDPVNCPFLIEDLKYVEVDENGDINKHKDKHRSHLLDCSRYLMSTFFNWYLKSNKNNVDLPNDDEPEY